MGLKIVHSELLLNDIITRILKLPKERFKGFRVEEIVSSWKKMLENIEKLFVIGEYEISVSSGTYIREYVIQWVERQWIFIDIF